MIVDPSYHVHAEVLSSEAYVYSSPESSGSKILLDFFNNGPYCNVTFFDLNEPDSLGRFSEIVEILSVSGIRVVPPQVCLDCLRRRHRTLKEVFAVYSSPVVGIFRNGNLAVIALGGADLELLDEMLADTANGVRVLAFDRVYSLSVEGVRARLEELFLGQRRNEMAGTGFLNLVSPVTLLAITDSANPCSFALYTGLLFITLHSLGRRRAAMTAFFFILAIFTGYIILGFGLVHILAVIPNAVQAIAIVGTAIGSLIIVRGLKPKFKSPIPKSLRGFLESRMGRYYARPIASLLLGLVASVTLLPCSSGLYMVCLGLVSTLKDPFQACFLLILYNIIFVTPFAMILVVVFFSRGLSRRIEAFRSTKLAVMELFSGLLLVAVCVYLLLS